MKILNQDLSLVQQLFPGMELAQVEQVGQVHKALQNITVPTYTGVEIYQVMKHQKTLLDSVVKFANSPDRFPFENALEASIPEVIKLSGIVKQYEMAMLGYPSIIDLSFLQWTQFGSELPAFMVLDLNSNTFTLKVTTEKFSRYDIGPSNQKTTFEISPRMPEEILNQYSVFVEPLAKMARSEENRLEVVSISAKHRGSPPKDITKKIQAALASKLFRKVLIVPVAPEWALNQVVEVWPDPIVIGELELSHPQYGALGSQFYFLGLYNPSPLEVLAVEAYQRKIPTDLIARLK